MSNATHLEPNLQTLGGRITCPRCQAMSKHSRVQCKKPAIKGKRVCRTHGGRSTGPKTPTGRQRCAAAKTVHGRETRQARVERSLGVARLAMLEAIGHQIGFMRGTRTRGPKPTRMAEAYPDFQVAFCKGCNLSPIQIVFGHIS